MKPEPITEEDLHRFLREYESYAAAGRAENIPLHRIYNAASKFGIDANNPTPPKGKKKPSTKKANKAKDGSVYVVSENEKEWGDIGKLIERRNLKTKDWFVKQARVNQWGGEAIGENDQLRVDLVPRFEMLLPAKTEGWKPPKPKKSERTNKGLVACLGDHHAPFHSRDLHAATVEWLREFKPERGVIIGDLLDYDQLSRHRPTPEWSRSVQECVNAGYNILRDYIVASPATKWQMLDGNHEERMRNKVIDQIRSVFGITRAQTEEAKNEPPVLATPYLLRLDELGVEWVDPAGGYENAQIKLTSELAVRHGYISKKGSGASARTTLQHLRYSIIVGHCHRQSIIHDTAHSIDGDPKVLMGCEAGTMAEIRGGLGYANNPDWQMGFATAQIYPKDGTFKVDLATYVDGLLMWRDWRCRGAAKKKK